MGQVLKQAVYRIEFEDQFQDFLIWDLAADGEVLDCQPFQAWVWQGRTVEDVDDLQVGSLVAVSSGDNELLIIRYPLIRVERIDRDAEGGDGADSKDVQGP